MIHFSFVHIGWTLKWKLFLVKIVRFVLSKLDILLQWEPENYGTERQHHSVFDVVTSQTKLISNLLNHLTSYMGLLESKLSSSYARFFWLSCCKWIL